MPKIRRAVAVGFPHHIVHRGNNRGRIFFDRQDRAEYLHLLKKYSRKWKSTILAYCLMTNHVHLLARPKTTESLSKMMQGVALCYTQYINRKYRRTGRLWENRYHSSIIDEERHLWAVVRYIEQNPWRARMVNREQDYPYSSAKAHLEGKEDDLLGEELFSEWQRKEYALLLKEAVPKGETKRITRAVRTETPFGSRTFTKRMELWLGHNFEKKLPGKPKHATNP